MAEYTGGAAGTAGAAPTAAHVPTGGTTTGGTATGGTATGGTARGGTVATVLAAAPDGAGPGELALVLAGLLADRPGWTTRTGEVWAHADSADAQMPAQGWKLHVSATPRDAHRMLLACAPVLLDGGSPFKVARSINVVRALTAGTCERGSSGKVLTAYPADGEAAVALAARLDAATLGLTGPRILSDRPLRPGSLVHYRYGTFTGRQHLTHDGELLVVLSGPDGAPVPDRREAGYVAPPWAVSPFPAAEPERATTASDGVLLDGRFAVTAAIRHANRGGVFRATDTTTGATVVVKQARAHVGAAGDGTDVRDLLRHEFLVLQSLSDTGRVPRPLALVEQGSDTFLVEEDLGGQTLRAWVAAGAGEGVAARPRHETVEVLRGIAGLVADLHARGVVLRDLSPNNILVVPAADGRPDGGTPAADGRPDGGTPAADVRLVDLELAVLPGADASGPRTGTPAYAPPEQFAGADADPAADAFALGSVLLHTCTAEDPLLGWGAATVAQWLDRGPRRRACGRTVSSLARDLCDPDPARRPSAATAARTLASLDPTAPALSASDLVEVSFAGLHAGLDGEQDPAAFDGMTGALLDRLLADLAPGRDALAVRSAFGETTMPTNVQHGGAGLLGVLVQAARTLDDGRARSVAARVARWLEGAADRQPRSGPVGLYFGHAGAAWALADAAVELDDAAMLRRATTRALALPRDWPGPDVTHGLAGLGLTLAHLWDLTGDGRLRDAIDDVAGALLSRGHRDDHGLTWSTPADAPSAFAGKRYHGYAHGTAGIGLFLLDAARVNGDARAHDAAVEAAAGLARAAVWADGCARWASGPEQPTPALAHWCNGSSGVATFLLRLPNLPAGAGDLLHGAACAVLGATWQSGIAYCHGMSGNADLLLELDEAGVGSYRRWAAHLAQVMCERATSDSRGPGLSDEPDRVAPDFSVGYAGALSMLLRLRHGGPRLWLPEVVR